MCGFHCFKMVQRVTAEGLSVPMGRERWGVVAMAVGQWHLPVNSVTSCLWAQSYNKPRDSPAGFLACFLQADLVHSQLWLVLFAPARTECPSPPHADLGRTATAVTFSRKPQWTSMDNLFTSEPKSSHSLCTQKKANGRLFWEICENTTFGGTIHVKDHLNMWNSSGSNPVVLDFIFTEQILFCLNCMWNGFNLQ